ncbi:MAG TPA: succinate dehydrogenase assembly factor 2 [Sphingomonadaceae bacterium]|nr:succinate dehydrogenase assembly factor 2 [Sphingomonadaceae bacterium]
MNRETRLKRLSYRAWHRGTMEADLMIGGFADTYAHTWDEAEIAWFETLMDEQDADIMAWAIGTQPVPDRYAGRMMDALRRLDAVGARK